MALTYTTTAFKIHGTDWSIRHFVDRIQFPTIEEQVEIGANLWGEDVPISLWPLCGVLWPSGLILAEIVSRLNLKDKRVLELGCGLALASMIAHHGGNPVTASDYNPFAALLLRENARINGLSPVQFLQLSWQNSFALQPFDLIIGSDILYEPDCATTLSHFLNMALAPDGQALFVDPGRAHVRKFETTLQKAGFVCDSTHPVPGQKTRVLRVTR